MTTKINIIRDQSDSFYRYKINKVSTNIVKKTTIFNNISTIAEQLYIDTDFIFLYIANILSTAVVIKDNKYILKGKYNNKIIQDLLFKFVEIFVLCSRCNDASTYLFALINEHKKAKLYIRCKSCGYKCRKKDKHLSDKMLKYVPIELEEEISFKPQSDDDADYWSGDEDFSEEAIAIRMKKLGIDKDLQIKTAVITKSIHYDEDVIFSNVSNCKNISGSDSDSDSDIDIDDL